MPSPAHHQVLVIGGGAAGITTSAILKRRAPSADVAIVEPSPDHYYQPAFTLVGAGAYDLARTRRDEGSLIPVGVRWIRAAAQSFEPDKNTVRLNNGDTVTYDYLVVCPGLKLDWSKVAGLAETLGKNGVCSNYSPTHVNYTWECVQTLKPGSRAVFTQPPLPFKCPGAPQKAVYLTADYLQRHGMLKVSTLNYYVHAPVIFGVPFFARELVKVAARYGVNVHYEHNLVAVDGAAKTAIFEKVGAQNKGERLTVPFDMLHVSPPQSPPEEIRSSPLVNAAGWIEVNQNTMQHVRHPNVFGLGDVTSTPNSKTAAAVRKQAPVVVGNLLDLMGDKALEGKYDGYASCPLTTAYGKAILAEFIYGGKVTPTLPLNPAKEYWIDWWIKTSFLPQLYWNYMLKGTSPSPSTIPNSRSPPDRIRTPQRFRRRLRRTEFRSSFPAARSPTQAEANNGLIAIPHPIITVNREKISSLAIEQRLPTVDAFRYRTVLICSVSSDNAARILIESSRVKNQLICPCRHRPNSGWLSISRPLKPLVSPFRLARADAVIE